MWLSFWRNLTLELEWVCSLTDILCYAFGNSTNGGPKLSQRYTWTNTVTLALTQSLLCAYLWLWYGVNQFFRLQPFLYTDCMTCFQTFLQELISRLDSRTLPLEPRHRCISSVLSICLRNDVLTSCLLTKHIPRWRDSYTRPTIWCIYRPHLQWSWTIRFQGNASTLNIVIFINHTWRQTDHANIRKKTTK